MLEPNLAIPPGESSYPVEQTWRFNDAVLLLAFFPHMHLRGKSFRYEAVYPDGAEEILLDVPRFDFGWQFRYALAEPKRLPAGSLLRCTAVYDNSKDNPANPDPSAVVRAGTQSWDEMFNGYFDVALADQDLTRPRPWSQGSGVREHAGTVVAALLLLAAGLLVRAAAALENCLRRIKNSPRNCRCCRRAVGGPFGGRRRRAVAGQRSAGNAREHLLERQRKIVRQVLRAGRETLPPRLVRRDVELLPVLGSVAAVRQTAVDGLQDFLAQAALQYRQDLALEHSAALPSALPRAGLPHRGLLLEARPCSSCRSRRRRRKSARSRRRRMFRKP